MTRIPAQLGGLLFFAIGLLGSVTTGDESPLSQPKQIAALQGHTNAVRCLALSPDGKTLVSGSDDLTVRIWSLPDAKMRTTLRGHQTRVEFVALTPDGSTIVSADRDGIIKVWDVAAGKERCQLTEQGEGIFSMVLADDGRTLLLAWNDNRLQRWDLATARCEATLAYETDRCWALAISPDGNRFAWGDRQEHKRLRLWDIASGNELPMPSDGRDVAPNAFSPDGKSLVVIIHSQDIIEMREVATGKTRSVLRDVHEGPLRTVALHPSGRILACASILGTGEVQFWDVAAGKLAGTVRGGSQGIESATFSADGNTLAAAEGPDTAIRVWDISPFWKLDPPVTAGRSERELESLWTDLAADDAAKAYQAMWRLSAASQEEFAWIAKRFRPVTLADPTRTAPLIAALDNDDFEAREKAARELTEIGDAAAPALRAALAAGASPETRQRAAAILARLAKADDLLPSQLRELRAVEALENTGTPEARRLLEKLAGGIAEARLTREAKDSLARLARRNRYHSTIPLSTESQP